MYTRDSMVKFKMCRVLECKCYFNFLRILWNIAFTNYKHCIDMNIYGIFNRCPFDMFAYINVVERNTWYNITI